MKRFKVDVLVRNNRLNTMQNNGLIVKYEILSDEEYLKELKNKVVEESRELLESENIDNLKEEVADVLEVLEHIVLISGFDFEGMQKTGIFCKDKKLTEKASEVLEASDVFVKQKMADFIKTIENIIISNSLIMEEINIIKTEKQNKIGSFDKKIKIKYIDIPEGNYKEMEYYLARPHKYPEIKS